MKTKKKRRHVRIAPVAIALLIGLGCAGIASYLLFAPQFHPERTTYVYIDRDDDIDSVCNKVYVQGKANRMEGFALLASLRNYSSQIRTGKYAIHPNDNVYRVFVRLDRGHQEAVRLTISDVRTTGRLFRSMDRQLMLDSAEIAAIFDTSEFQARTGYTPETLPCLFIPETYYVYWDIGTADLAARLQKEYHRFWNTERVNKAKEMGITPHEVSTLASIVAEETNDRNEKPVVAGLYINRLRMGMPLQADPSVKFALKNFELKRITNAQLQTDSPYNTYLYAGLPPGPIRIASPADIDAVLNYTSHNYIYMCAKEDFSGTHHFASTYEEHMKNARKYWKALNERKIFK